MQTLSHPKSGSLLDAHIVMNNVERLLPADVHIWTINRSIYNDQISYSDYLLDEDEQARAQKFRFKKDHDLFVIGRYCTKILLGYYTGCSPETVKITPDVWGKPTCNLNLSFNISHSADYLLLGFSNFLLGVDIEKENSLIDADSIAKSYFSEMEFQMLMNASGDKKMGTFFEIWTKKESLIKGIGKGLGISLPDFNVTDSGGKIHWSSTLVHSYGDWYTREIETKQGYKSAFATQNPSAHLIYHHLEI